MEFDSVEEAAKRMRYRCIEMTYNAGSAGAHIGGALSLIEIMATLYLKILNVNGTNLYDESRDRLILSKGHGAMAMYAAMAEAGILSQEQLSDFKKDDSIISAHPSVNAEIGIEFSSGSLGQGLSLAVGVCLALKRKKNYSSRVYVVLGDGECNEGAVWEAAMSASQFKLDNLVAIIDCNHLQYDGACEEIMSNEPFEKRWEGFGWDVNRINGHSAEEIYTALKKENDRPYVVIADTIKGKGVSFMENNSRWHNGRLDKSQYERALQEVM